MTTNHSPRTVDDLGGKPKTARARRGRGEATELACSRLMRIIETMAPHDRLPGLRSLQAQIGVSQGTLNAALDKLEQKRVLLRRERSGVYVAPHAHQRTICLICSREFFLRSNGSPFWQLLIERAEDMASAHETRLSIAFAEAGGKAPDDTLPEYLRGEIRRNNFDGVISVGLPSEAVLWIESQNVPVVSFAGSSRYTVTTSRVSFIEQGVAALARTGCQNISLLLPPHDSAMEYCSRLEKIFRRSLGANGVPQGTVVANAETAQGASSVYCPPRIENGWEWTHRVFGRDAETNDRPDGVLVADDMIAQGLLMAFDNLGMEPGRGVAVVCYANAGSPVLLGWQNRVFRLEYDVAALVECLFATLESLMDNGADALTGAFVPPYEYDTTEYQPSIPGERFRLLLPRLLFPESATR